MVIGQIRGREQMQAVRGKANLPAARAGEDTGWPEPEGCQMKDFIAAPHAKTRDLRVLGVMAASPSVNVLFLNQESIAQM